MIVTIESLEKWGECCQPILDFFYDKFPNGEDAMTLLKICLDTLSDKYSHDFPTDPACYDRPSFCCSDWGCGWLPIGVFILENLDIEN